MVKDGLTPGKMRLVPTRLTPKGKAKPLHRQRFNRTVQEDLLAEDLRAFNQYLLDHLDRYNGQRPHRGIDNRILCQMLAQ